MGSPLPAYRVPAADLDAGESLGNSALWVTTKATGALEQVFSLAAGCALVGSVGLRYGLCPPGQGPPSSEGTPSPPRSPYLPLAQPSGTMILHPWGQVHEMTLTPVLTVVQTVFLPLGLGDDPPLVYAVSTLHNTSSEPLDVRVEGVARLAGLVSTPICPHYDLSSGALVAHNRDESHLARAFGCASPLACWWTTTADLGRAYDPQQMPAADGQIEEGDVLALLQVDLHLAPRTAQDVAFVLALSHEGPERALAEYRACAPYEEALAQTTAHLEHFVARGRVLTPDPVITAGALWSKVNMRRVMGHYPQGWAFTNDPGHSSAVVARDAAWFVYGCDHVAPDFSRALLEGLVRAREPSGKIPEYYHALSGLTEDDGLNINDDTPLFILAVAHHYRCTGDRDWLAQIYPAIERAAACIMAQHDARGLVFCAAKDARGNVWASASWRNIIPQYSLNGAVTEVNAECVAALHAASSLAALCAAPEDAEIFATAAARLRVAMDRHLLNKKTGLYHLHIDPDGVVHSDVTADLLFPVLFEVCSQETAARIISRLGHADFWTPAGLRTASRHDPLYDPSGNVGLLGGVWPGVTWWLAMACAREHPEMMVQALRRSFAHYAADPRLHNTVPGQFSEWFDGESLVNRGMRLSPWEPPRFLWATVEGVCGLRPQEGPPAIHPVLPLSWKWVALRDAPYQGTALSYVVVRQGVRLHVYSNALVQSDAPAEVYQEDVSSQVPMPLSEGAVLALRRPGEVLVFIGNAALQRTVVPLDLFMLLDAYQKYQVRQYNSEHMAWSRTHTMSIRELCANGLVIEQGGFHLVQIQEST